MPNFIIMQPSKVDNDKNNIPVMHRSSSIIMDDNKTTVQTAITNLEKNIDNINISINSSKKAYITGIPSETDNDKSRVYDPEVYLSDIPGRLVVKSIQIGDKVIYCNPTSGELIIDNIS